MLHDKIGFIPVRELPDPPTSTDAVLMYLETAHGGYEEGLYIGVNGAWAPVGSSNGGAAVKTLVYDSDTSPIIDLGADVGSGLILSTVVRRLGTADVQMYFKEKATGSTLETVNITKEYTPIVIPQPYNLYRLEAPTGLEITVKFI